MTPATTFRRPALREAKRVLKSRIDTLLRAAQEIEKTLKRMDECTDNDTAGLSNIFNWSVNDIQNVLLNLGFPELCRTQSMLDEEEVARAEWTKQQAKR